MKTFIDRLPILTTGALDIPRSIPGRKLRVIPHVPSVDHLSSITQAARESRLQDIKLSDYAVGLEQRINSAFQNQRSWYDAIEREANQQLAEHDRVSQQARSDWTRQLEAKRREQDELERTQRELREMHRLEQEELRWLEQERMRREEDEANRVRRQRLRECTVCLDEYDLSIMYELACNHWYCTRHLQGRTSKCPPARQLGNLYSLQRHFASHGRLATPSDVASKSFQSTHYLTYFPPCSKPSTAYGLKSVRHRIRCTAMIITAVFFCH